MWISFLGLLRRPDETELAASALGAEGLCERGLNVHGKGHALLTAKANPEARAGKSKDPGLQ